MRTARANPECRTGVYGVVGAGIGYSQSPQIFRRVFERLNWPATYALYDLSPRQLPRFLKATRDVQIRGLNVTKPYKTRVMAMLDSLAGTAASVRAVNTVAFQGGRLVGHNTDIDGVVAVLRPHAADLKYRMAVIFGAGGAARAVAYTLLTELRMSQVMIAARDPRKARRMIHELQERLPLASDAASAAFAPASNLDSAIKSAALIVNATPLGGEKFLRQSPLPGATKLSRRSIALDLVYQPRNTVFLRQAKAAGCRVVGGWPMLVAQADASFHIWTGERFPTSLRKELLAYR